MNEADRLRKLFAYDRWGCHTVLEVLSAEKAFALRDEATATFAHIVASQEQWYSRITSDHGKKIELWPDGNLIQSQEQLQAVSEKWPELIDTNQQQLDRYIVYQNSKGDTFRTKLSDILHHVIIHGQHHRAQIATLLRRSDIAPPPTDYIFYLRQQEI